MLLIVKLSRVSTVGIRTSREHPEEAEASDAVETAVESSNEESAATGSSQVWAMLIKRVYEVDPLCCPECGGQMQVVSFIEPPQSDVIEAILSHCGLWPSRSPRAPPDADELVLELDAAYSGNAIDSTKRSRRVPRIDVRRYRHLPGESLIIPDAGRHDDAAAWLWVFNANFALIDVHFLLGQPRFALHPKAGRLFLGRLRKSKFLISKISNQVSSRAVFS